MKRNDAYDREQAAKRAAFAQKLAEAVAKAKMDAGRPDPINESPSYRAAMIDAGRGRLLR